ncbi:MAG: hypothetical protein J5827_02100 [Oscillospiraceae bacterium]|nr:hypothetical protein [Oscillospiraceae bacterium]
MFNVKIAEGSSKKASPYIRECLKKAAREGRIDAALCAGSRVDLLIMPRGAGDGGEKAGCMLLAGGQTPAGEVKSVRCGLSRGDELTLSSIGRENALLTLRKDITTLSGELLEPQEISVELTRPAEPEAVLAAAGAMLLLGADPGGLKLS